MQVKNITNLFNAFLSIATLIACKKSNDFDSYIKFATNSININCDKDLKANPADRNLNGFLQIEGAWATGSLELTVHNFKNTPAQYSIGGDHNVRFFINDTLFLAAFDSFGGGAIGGGTLRIAEVTDDYVKGSFDYRLVGNSITKQITNGEFYMKRKW
jgi:hypothetical protein